MPATDFPTPQGRESLEIELRCPVEPRVLALLRCFSSTLAKEAGFSQEGVDQIEMAVDEACANVIRHAYKHLGVSPDLGCSGNPPGGAPECVIKMRVTLGDGWVQFQIIDHGIGANHTPPGVESLDEFIERGAKGGLGIYIIRNFMDEVTFEYPEGKGTVVTMTKYLKPSESA